MGVVGVVGVDRVIGVLGSAPMTPFVWCPAPNNDPFVCGVWVCVNPDFPDAALGLLMMLATVLVLPVLIACHGPDFEGYLKAI